MLERISYLQARLLLLLLGVGIAMSQAFFAWDRGAAGTEVLAPVLYIPIFIGAVFWVMTGALAGAVFSSVVYGVLLYDQSRIVGLSNFQLLLVSRVFFFFFVAVIVAVGIRSIEGRLRKLELYDQIDDVTGLYNSAFFLQDSDLEQSRATRYQTIFSIVVLDLDRQALPGARKRQADRTIKDLATTIEGSVRQMDRAARLFDGDLERFLIILPETGTEGARVFTERLRDSVREFLGTRGGNLEGTISVSALTYPDDAEAIEDLRAEVRRVDEARRPIRGAG